MNYKGKLLDLNLNKNELMNLFYFEEEDAREEGSKYLDLKGTMYYINMINFLIGKGLAMWCDDKIKYRIVSDFFRYDKRLRLIIYTYIGALEEYFRGYIADNRIDFLASLNKNNKIRYEELLKMRGFIKKNQVSQLLEFSFRDTVNVILDNQNGSVNIDKETLKRNLTAVVDLRNKVNHFKLILMCNDLKRCQGLGGKNRLKNNLINLKRLLPECFRGNLVKEINCAMDGLVSKELLTNIKIDISEISSKEFANGCT